MHFELKSEHGEVLLTMTQSEGRVVITQDDVVALYPEQADAYLSALKLALIEATEEDLND